MEKSETSVTLLIISEYIAPVQAIASIRWTKIAKYLKRDNEEISITVLSNEKNYDNPENLLPLCRKDSLLEQDSSIFDAYWTFSPDKALIRYYRLKKRTYGTTEAIDQTNAMSSCVTWKNRLRQDMHNLLNDYKNSLLAAAAWKFFEGKNRVFDAIISSYGPVWTHLVAEKIKNKYPQTVWLADFRDPYAKETDGPFSFWRHNLFVKRHCIAADVITRVTDDLYLNEPENAVVKMLPNGYDPQEALMPLAPPIFSLVFTGTLYGEQTDLGVVFQALKDLQCEKKINPKTVRLIYAGAQGAIAQNFSKKHDAECFIDNRGIVSREDAMHIQQNAAILIQLGWNNEHEKSFWTGKTYEYMMANKPILYIMTGNIPNSAPSQNIHHLGGVCYEQCRHKETYPLLKQYILDKYEEWKRTGNVSIQRDEEYVQQYSYANIAESVWKLICSQEKGRV